MIDNELRQKLIRDLEKTGFSSEMKALHEYIKRGWGCTASSIYVDTDTNAHREIDLHATLLRNTRSPEGDRIASWQFIAAEVKKAETPWVVFRQAVSRVQDAALLERSHSLHMFYGTQRGLMEQALANSLEMDSVANECGWIGYGLHESFKKPNEHSRWYGACMTAVKAAEYYLKLERKIAGASNAGLQKGQRSYEYLHSRPLVILDGQLTSAWLDANGQPALEEISMAAINFTYELNVDLPRIYRVDIITLQALGEYIDRCAQRMQRIEKDLINIALNSP